jgi:proteasome lid subunit RPN8/RPN11
MIKFIDQVTCDQMIEIGIKGYPFEICGLLIGTVKEYKVVEKIFECKNLNKLKPETRYEMDGKDYINGEQLAAKNHMQVLGIFHSHPDHPDMASETDRQAAWPEFSYVIMSIQNQKFFSMKSWVLNEKTMQFQEEKIDITLTENV